MIRIGLEAKEAMIAVFRDADCPLHNVDVQSALRENGREYSLNTVKNYITVLLNENVIKNMGNAQINPKARPNATYALVTNAVTKSKTSHTPASNTAIIANTFDDLEELAVEIKLARNCSTAEAIARAEIKLEIRKHLQEAQQV
jgi:hypothetical protein